MRRVLATCNAWLEGVPRLWRKQPGLAGEETDRRAILTYQRRRAGEGPAFSASPSPGDRKDEMPANATAKNAREAQEVVNCAPAKVDKPPLGLMPHDKWSRQVSMDRRNAIVSAMRRYAEAEKPIPVFWVNELETLLDAGASSNHIYEVHQTNQKEEYRAITDEPQSEWAE